MKPHTPSYLKKHKVHVGPHALCYRCDCFTDGLNVPCPTCKNVDRISTCIWEWCSHCENTPLPSTALLEIQKSAGVKAKKLLDRANSIPYPHPMIKYTDAEIKKKKVHKGPHSICYPHDQTVPCTFPGCNGVSIGPCIVEECSCCEAEEKRRRDALGEGDYFTLPQVMKALSLSKEEAETYLGGTGLFRSSLNVGFLIRPHIWRQNTVETYALQNEIDATKTFSSERIGAILHISSEEAESYLLSEGLTLSAEGWKREKKKRTKKRLLKKFYTVSEILRAFSLTEEELKNILYKDKEVKEKEPLLKGYFELQAKKRDAIYFRLGLRKSYKVDDIQRAFGLQRKEATVFLRESGLHKGRRDGSAPSKKEEVFVEEADRKK